MKRAIVLVSLLVTFFVFSENVTGKKGGIVNIPERDKLFEELGLEIELGKKRQFVLADRKSGVYFGETFKNRGGDYKVNDRNTFKDFIAFENGKAFNKKNADRCVFYPYGLSYFYGNNVKTEFMLLQGDSGVAISIEGDESEEYSLAPALIMASKAENMSYEFKDGVLLITADNKGELHYGAVVYQSGVKVDEVYTADKLPENIDFKVPENSLYAGKFTAKGGLKLIFIFDTDKNKVLAKAKEYENIDSKINDIKDFFYEMVTLSYTETEDKLFNKALAWSVISGNTMVNTRYKGMGIYAGFPWFQQNWGRDTFISLPGISIVTGRFDETKSILKNFSDYQNRESEKKMYGRIPNRVMDKSIIYNTTDGTPWMIREAYEYLMYTNDTEYAKEMYEVAKIAIDGSEKNFTDEEGFLTHADADTWMDAKLAGKSPWSPRGKIAVEIQALWYNQLLVSSKLAELAGEKEDAKKWALQAAELQDKFNDKFWNKKDKMFYDRIDENGVKDRRIRPNQLMTYTIPMEQLVPDDKAALMVKNSLSKLLYPYGVASLDKKDPYFHPFHLDDHYHKDAAYHNGTIWGWNAGPAVETLCDFGYQDFAYEFTSNLAYQIIDRGALGTMSENMDALPHKGEKEAKLTGTYSQAWSVSEFARVFYQVYAGIIPNLLEKRVKISPKFPKKLGKTSVVQKIGGGSVELTFDGAKYGVSINNDKNLKVDFIFSTETGEEYLTTFEAVSGKVYTLTSKSDKFYVNDKEVDVRKIKDSYKKSIGTMKFVDTKLPFGNNAVKKKNFLQEIVKNGLFKIKK